MGLASLLLPSIRHLGRMEGGKAHPYWLALSVYIEVTVVQLRHICGRDFVRLAEL
jgi:hypothetical protein